jgi:putative ABC transport system permease protein
MLLDTLQQACILFPLAIGIYLSYQVLHITDLTVEGSFVAGAIVFVKILQLYDNYFLAFFLAVIACAVIGLIIAYIQKDDRIDPLIAGILMIFMLYSVNLQILGTPNLIISHQTLADVFQEYFGNYGYLIIASAMSLLVTIFILVLLTSKLGLYLRAYGENKKLLANSGQHVEKFRLLGLVFSNILAGISGIITAQIYGFADVNMGFGIALTAIAAFLIGQQLFSKFVKAYRFHCYEGVCAGFIGIFIYALANNILLRFGIDPVNLKLVLGLVLILFLKYYPQNPRRLS